MAKADIKTVREFFKGDGPAVPITELKPLKKGSDDVPIPDYDQIANGIGDGTFNYKLQPGQREAALANWPAIADKLGLTKA